MCQKCEERQEPKSWNPTHDWFAASWNEAVDFMTKANTEGLSEPALRHFSDVIAERVQMCDAQAALDLMHGRLDLDGLHEQSVNNTMMTLLIGIGLGQKGFEVNPYRCEDFDKEPEPMPDGKSNLLDFAEVLGVVKAPESGE